MAEDSKKNELSEPKLIKKKNLPKADVVPKIVKKKVVIKKVIKKKIVVKKNDSSIKNTTKITTLNEPVKEKKSIKVDQDKIQTTRKSAISRESILENIASSKKGSKTFTEEAPVQNEAPIEKAPEKIKVNYSDNIKKAREAEKRKVEAQAQAKVAGTRHYRPKNMPKDNDAGRSFSSQTRSGVSNNRSQGTGGGRSGGFQGRSGGFQGRSGGFQGRSGGFQGRPGGFQGRSGGFQGKPGGPPSRGQQEVPPTSGREEGKKHHNKRFFKSKKKDYSDSAKSRNEKSFQISKKKEMPKTNSIPKEIDILDVITVSELAKKMNLKAADLIGKLFSMGMMATINQQIDSDTATLLADEYGCKVNLVNLYDETLIEKEKDTEENLTPRPPIITVMGHVDHGKTKLLDAIRETNVVAGEHGGITQHIGAYKINKDGKDLVFLDTPGHSAFTLMRARGAQVTDMVILVVAANDGVMPQTIEAINHAKDASVPVIVAVNKCDLPESNVDLVKQQLSKYELIPEDWGGSTLFCEISALKKQGIEHLLEVIFLQAEMMELKANYNTRAEGKVVESRVEQGRGIVSTIIVQRGTLKKGDAYVAGVFSGKVRAMFNDLGKEIEEATPSTPVEIIGLTGIPDAGAPFQVTTSEKEAKQVSAKRQELDRLGEAKNVKKITLDNLYDTIQDGTVQELKVIVKGDVHGSVEAIKSSLEKIGNKEIRVNVIHASAGTIVESDVNLAAASNAIIIGFHVRPTPKASALADSEKVEIRKYQIIYDVIEDMKSAMEGMLTPDYEEEIIGTIEVRDTFKVPKIGLIAGCYVKSGMIDRNSKVHLIREGIEIFTGKISSLKRFKDDVKEVKESFECGIGLVDFNDIKEGDILEVFKMKEIRKKLETK